MVVKSNKILEIFVTGVALVRPLSSTEIEGNTIENSPTGIDFGCEATNGRVQSNTIIDGAVGVSNIPSGTTSINTLCAVGAETGGSCP